MSGSPFRRISSSATAWTSISVTGTSATSASTGPKGDRVADVRAQPTAAGARAPEGPGAPLLVDHPLAVHRLSGLRDVATDSPTFRQLVAELSTFVVYEAL